MTYFLIGTQIQIFAYIRKCEEIWVLSRQFVLQQGRVWSPHVDPRHGLRTLSLFLVQVGLCLLGCDFCQSLHILRRLRTYAMFVCDPKPAHFLIIQKQSPHTCVCAGFAYILSVGFRIAYTCVLFWRAGCCYATIRVSTRRCPRCVLPVRQIIGSKQGDNACLAYLYAQDLHQTRSLLC